jgi:hypothetical protein
MNPNNAAYAAAKVNHGNQLNPCHAEYAGSRGESHSADSKPASNDD